MSAGPELEDLLRELAPQVLGALVRRHGQFDACEDAVQEALLAAAQQWPEDGVPETPAGLADRRRDPAADRRDPRRAARVVAREDAVVAPPERVRARGRGGGRRSTTTR